MNAYHAFILNTKKRLDCAINKAEGKRQKNAKNIHIKMNNKTTPIITISKKMDVPANRVVYEATNTQWN